MKTIDLQQGSEDWLSWRNSGCGASDIAALLGVSPWKDACDLFRDKMGLSSSYVNASMARGTEYEGMARSVIEEDMGMSFQPRCVQHDDYPFVIASLDGYNEAARTVLEIKIPSEDNYYKMCTSKDVPAHYKIQVQWQLLITGAKKAILAFFDPHTSAYMPFEILPDLETQEACLNACKEFWEENVMKGVSPKSEHKDDYLELTDAQLYPICKEYLVFDEMEKVAVEGKKNLKPRILDFSDHGNFKAFGLKSTWTKSRVTYDIDAMRADGVEVDKYQKQPKIEGYFAISREKL